MKNQKAIVGGLLLTACAMTTQAQVNYVVLNESAYTFDVGGEFSANTTQNFLGNYSPSALVGTAFQTFCIETTVDFIPGDLYTYNLSSVDSRGVALTEGAAYLYYEFAKGTLANYNYTDPTIRKADAGALEAALWWFQGNQTYGGFPNPTTDIYYEEATNALGGSANAFAPENGKYGVDVLQIWYGNTPAQNQLVLVPDQTATTGLLAASVGALIIARRRFQAC